MQHHRFLTVALVALLAASAVPALADGGADKYDQHLLRALEANPLAVSVIIVTDGPAAPVAERATLLGMDVTWTYTLIDGFAGSLPVAQLDAVSEDPRVLRVHLDRAVAPVMDISHQAIEADKAWAAGYTGAGITVAVLDTGIDSLHPFFSGAIASCVSTIGGLVSPECTDSDGHGTHVAGTVASRDDKYPGVAPQASLAVVRVLHAVGAGTSADIIAGMEWVANNQHNVNPPIRAATMSIGYVDPGCGDDSDPMAQAANALVDSGIPFTVAAGNSGHDTCTIDGASAASKVITIAAVDDMATIPQDDDVIAEFSSGGGDGLAKPDVSFPGVDITSAFIGAGTLIATMDGTSMATPHAAGVMALLLEQDPSLTAQQVKDTITGSAVKTENTGSSWNTVYGHGLGNACTALALNTCASSGGGGGGGNSAPTASFTYACTDLACDFDGTGSSDSDGTIQSYSWDFGDGNTATGATVSHTYGASGDYTVTLTVTDDAGAADTDSQVVSVSASSSGISLSVTPYKVKGKQHVDLTWSGATSTSVDVYRDGSVITTTANDGAYTDNIGARGGGSYVYRVCEAGTSTCSNEATATF